MARKKRTTRKPRTTVRKSAIVNDVETKTVSVDSEELSKSKPVIAGAKKYTEVEIVEPKVEKIAEMVKDAGAGIVKYCKIVAITNAENESYLIVKSGKFGEAIASEKIDCEDFDDAILKAHEILEHKKVRGYKPK